MLVMLRQLPMTQQWKRKEREKRAREKSERKALTGTSLVTVWKVSKDFQLVGNVILKRLDIVVKRYS